MTNTSFFPLIGAGPVSRDAARGYNGRWFLVDLEDNSLTSAPHPRLLDINVDIKFGYLVLTAAGMLRLDLVLDVVEDDESVQRIVYLDGQAVTVVDEGDLAATWFEHVLGEPCRLVKRLE